MRKTLYAAVMALLAGGLLSLTPASASTVWTGSLEAYTAAGSIYLNPVTCQQTSAVTWDCASQAYARYGTVEHGSIREQGATGLATSVSCKEVAPSYGYTWSCDQGLTAP